jgi:AraC-like DNA-binding protein
MSNDADAINQLLQLLELFLQEHPAYHGAVIDAIRKAQTGRLLDMEQMARLLHCSVNHLENLMLNGDLKEGRDYINIASRHSKKRLIRFKPEACIKALEKPAPRR